MKRKHKLSIPIVHKPILKKMKSLLTNGDYIGGYFSPGKGFLYNYSSAIESYLIINDLAYIVLTNEESYNYGSSDWCQRIESAIKLKYQ